MPHRHEQGFMITQHRALQLFCAASLFAVSSHLFAAPQGYYRWHDDAGVEHFTQQPPPGRKSDFIATSTGKSTAVEAGETAASTEAKTAAKDAAKKTPTGAIQAVPDKDPEKCKQAQDSQTTLNSHARIREKVGEEYRYLTPEEIAEQKKLAQESVEVYCEPAPAK